MRIAQIIDTLDVGGAERMALNYANALSEKVVFSGLVVTRREGNLKNQLDPEVGYLFLNKKGKIGLGSIRKLKSWCKAQQVGYIHAHGFSFFTACQLKIIHPKIKIIWHDHYGLSEFLANRPKWLLKMASYSFGGIISVNNQLKKWAMETLNCKNTIYLPNFTGLETGKIAETNLKGIRGKKILCLANLRPQKNHFLLLNVANRLKKSHPDWTFHLVGKDFNDEYSEAINKFLLSEGLADSVFLYGAKNDIGNIIDQSEIAILTSHSEGLPVSLLEYGIHAKAVVVTDVGEIKEIISNGKNGYIVPAGDEIGFYKSLLSLIEDSDRRISLGKELFNTVSANHSKEAVISRYLNWIKTI